LEPRYTVAGVDTRYVRQSKSEQVLFKSTFTNSTERAQEYSFKTHRSTRSIATICIAFAVFELNRIYVGKFGKEKQHYRERSMSWDGHAAKAENSL
uniref:Transposase n=1 Tax=Gongylonema pulchrum TaxID=637853 RepID=A0A183EKS3_9BILA